MTGLTMVAGVAVLAVTTFDLLTVTIGGGTRFALSTRVAGGMFRLLRLLSRLIGTRVLTEISGVVVVMAAAACWITGFWLGWSLVFGAGGGVELTREGMEAEAVHAPIHVGHLLSTLGGAVTRPAGPGWALASALVGLNGMLAITLSVSFLLATRSTLQSARAYAALAATGGADPGALVERLAEVVAGLHASPFALWYGHTRPDRRVPDALLAHAQQAEAAGGAVAARVRALMRDLPHWSEREGEPFLAAMERWTRAHLLVREG